MTIKRLTNRIGRRLCSRILLGLSIKGDYYFLTLTSSKESPPIEKSWKNLRRWLKRYRPMTTFCYCLTSEGHGVIHMVLRLGSGEKRLDVNELRSYWIKTHKAQQLKLIKIRQANHTKLANYIADQRRRRKLGSEMAYQDQIIRWKYSRGWIPTHFAKEFGRYYFRCKQKNVPDNVMLSQLKPWLTTCHQKSKIVPHPKITIGE